MPSMLVVSAPNFGDDECGKPHLILLSPVLVFRSRGTERTTIHSSFSACAPPGKEILSFMQDSAELSLSYLLADKCGKIEYAVFSGYEMNPCEILELIHQLFETFDFYQHLIIGIGRNIDAVSKVYTSTSASHRRYLDHIRQSLIMPLEPFCE